MVIDVLEANNNGPIIEIIDMPMIVAMLHPDLGEKRGGSADI